MARLLMLFIEASTVDSVTKTGPRKLAIPTRNIYSIDYGSVGEDAGAEPSILIAAKGINTQNWMQLETFPPAPPLFIECETGSEVAPPSSIYGFVVTRHNMKFYDPPKLMALNLEYLIYAELINGVITMYFEGHNQEADVDYDVFEVVIVNEETSEPLEDQWTAFQEKLGAPVEIPEGDPEPET